MKESRIALREFILLIIQVTTREGASVIYNYSDTTRDNSLASVVGEYAQVRIPVLIVRERFGRGSSFCR